MRYTLIRNSCFLFLVLGFSGVTYAAGNVLLPQTPSSGNDTSSLPNLGLGQPTSSSPSNATVPQPQNSPPPALAPTITTNTSQPPTTVRAVNAKQISQLPLGTLPTRIIERPDTSSELAQAGANLPYVLTIQISKNSLFGTKDVQNINAKIGLTAAQIASSCALGFRGFLRTDKGMHMIDSGPSPQTQIHYDGIIKSYQLGAIALCVADESRFPAGGGYITKIGARYLVSLQPITCTPPNRQVNSMTINYDGTGSSSCNYN